MSKEVKRWDELKALAEAFPSDLDWDSNTEPFFNGPTGESLGGGSDGTYAVYGKPFRLEGEDYDYDGPTYVERCNVEFAKFMVSAREGVLELIAENEALLAERDALKKDAARWRHARSILTVDAIETAQSEYINFGLPPGESESIRADQAIDAAMQGAQP